MITVAGTAIGISVAGKTAKPILFSMRISDLFLAFPGLVFALLAVAGVLGGGIQNAIIARQ